MVQVVLLGARAGMCTQALGFPPLGVLPVFAASGRLAGAASMGMVAERVGALARLRWRRAGVARVAVPLCACLRAHMPFYGWRVAGLCC